MSICYVEQTYTHTRTHNCTYTLDRLRLFWFLKSPQRFAFSPYICAGVVVYVCIVEKYGEFYLSFYFIHNAFRYRFVYLYHCTGCIEHFKSPQWSFHWTLYLAIHQQIFNGFKSKVLWQNDFRIQWEKKNHKMDLKNSWVQKTIFRKINGHQFYDFILKFNFLNEKSSKRHLQREKGNQFYLLKMSNKTKQTMKHKTDDRKQKKLLDFKKHSNEWIIEIMYMSVWDVVYRWWKVG